MKDKFTSLWLFLLRGISKFFAILPDCILYLFADIISFVLYRIVGYRKGVVRKNLVNSFPLKDEKEIKEIEKRYFTHLGNLMVESIALGGFSKEKITKRMVYVNNEEFATTLGEGSGIAAIAHYGNWEYTTGYSLKTNKDVYAVYHPLKNKTMDEFFKGFRSTFGTNPLSMNIVPRRFAQDCNEKRSSIYALIADQTPVGKFIKYRVMFLNQPTAFFTGMEQLSTKYHLPIFYIDIEQVKRGYYQGSFIKLYDGKEQVSEHEIIKRYARVLEQAIEREPHLWLWSHKRWKHPMKPGDIVI